MSLAFEMIGCCNETERHKKDKYEKKKTNFKNTKQSV